MGQQRGILTPEERARVMQLQDLLIERFVEHREAVAEGQEETRQDSGGPNRQSSARKGRDREMGGCRLGLAARIGEASRGPDFRLRCRPCQDDLEISSTPQFSTVFDFMVGGRSEERWVS